MRVLLRKPNRTMPGVLSVMAYSYEYADDGVVKAADGDPSEQHEDSWKDAYGITHPGTGDKVGKNWVTCPGSKYSRSSPDGDILDMWYYNDCVE